MKAKEIRLLARKLRCSPSTIRKHLKAGTLEQFRRDREYMIERGLDFNVVVYWRGDKGYTIKELVDKTGMSRATAHRRLISWRDGEISDEQLLQVGKIKTRAKIHHKMNDDELEMLRKIPGPTAYEKKHPELLGPCKTRW